MSDKKFTVAELKTFIDAVEFATEIDDTVEWTPTPKQWKRIRAMIDNLEETVAPAVQHQPQMMQVPQFPHPMQHIPMGMDAPGIPAGPSPLMQPQQSQPMLPPQQIGGVRAPFGSEGMKAKTPDIDTSRGNYQSSFA